jgi:hypothetical protein
MYVSGLSRLIVMYVPLCVLYCVLFVCKCVLDYCHWDIEALFDFPNRIFRAFSLVVKQMPGYI